MRIDRVKVQNFMCFADLDLQLSPKMNLLIGDNGSGKSALLKVLEVGLGCFFTEFETHYKRNILANEGRRNSSFEYVADTVCEFSGQLDNRQVSWSRTFDCLTRNNDSKAARTLGVLANSMVRSLDVVLPIIVSYPASRLHLFSRSSKNLYIDGKSRRDGYKASLTRDSFIELILDFIQARQSSFGYANSMLGNEMSDNVLWNINSVINDYFQVFLGLDIYNSVFVIRNDELTIAYSNSGKLCFKSVSGMSSGTLNLFYLLVDLVWRASTLNPQLNFVQLKEKVSGVVLIDELDLFLHPKWQQNVLEFLSNLFPNVQYVLSTHSSWIISSFKPSYGNLLKLESKDGTAFAQLQQNWYGYDVSTISLSAQDVPPDKSNQVKQAILEYRDTVESLDDSDLENKYNEFSAAHFEGVDRIDELIDVFEMEFGRRKVNLPD